MPRPSPPPWAPKHLAPPSRRQPSSSFSRPTRFHAHRCSRLTRQHGGEQSGLVTLTFDLLTLKVVSQSPVTWATSVPLLVFLGLFVLDLCPIFATDRRQTSDSRQTASSLNASAYRERGIVKHRAFSWDVVYTVAALSLFNSNSFATSAALGRYAFCRVPF